MPDYAITGKKGAGKSLVSVARIQEYINEGRMVATNLNLNLRYLVGKDNKTARVVRLPDWPCGSDLDAIGKGNLTPDEERNGIIVLDELAIWCNAREYKGEDRQGLINRLVQLRKDGWDCYYLVQTPGMCDKQIREGLFEHVVSCKRLDRMPVPFISPVWRFFRGKPLYFPRVHLGFVFYGDGAGAIQIDKWIYRGVHLYRAYDTRQKFRKDYPHGPFSYIPPYYTHGRFRAVFTRANQMRITKILWRKYSRPGVFFAGLFLALALSLGVFFWQLKPVPTVAAVNTDMIDKLSGGKIVAYSNLPGRIPHHRIAYGDGQEITTPELVRMGYNLRDFSRNTVTIAKGGKNVVVTR